MRISEETVVLDKVLKEIECPSCKNSFEGTVKSMQYIIRIFYFIPISKSSEIIINCPSCKSKLIYHQAWGKLLATKTRIKTFKPRNSIINKSMFIGSLFLASMPVIGIIFASVYFYLNLEKPKSFQLGSKIILSFSILMNIISLCLFLSGGFFK